jgi:hypothetical protein
MTSNRHFAYVQLFCGGCKGRRKRPAYAPSCNQRTIVEKRRTGQWIEIQRLASLCFLTATLTLQGGCQAALDATLGSTTLGARTLGARTLGARTLGARTLVMRTLVDESLAARILVMETLVDESLVAGILAIGTLDNVTLGAPTLCFLAATWVRQNGH